MNISKTNMCRQRVELSVQEIRVEFDESYAFNALLETLENVWGDLIIEGDTLNAETMASALHDISKRMNSLEEIASDTNLSQEERVAKMLAEKAQQSIERIVDYRKKHEVSRRIHVHVKDSQETVKQIMNEEIAPEDAKDQLRDLVQDLRNKVVDDMKDVGLEGGIVEIFGEGMDEVTKDIDDLDIEGEDDSY